MSMLKWDYYCRGEYTPDGMCHTRVGGIELSCHCNGRVYKDGARQYMIYLSVPGADSKEIITLAKVRGHLADAQAKAEEFVQGLFENLTVLAEVKWCEQSSVGGVRDKLIQQVSALKGEINNLHHEIQGLLVYDEEKVPNVEKRLLEVLTELHHLVPDDELYFKMCDMYCFDTESEETHNNNQFYDYPTKEDLLNELYKTEE